MADPKITISAVDRTAPAFASAQRNLRSLGDQTDRVSGLLGKLGLSISVGVAVAWAKGLNDGVDALNDVADATGATIENISALEDIAARTGTQFEVVTSGLVRFNNILKDAKPGSTQAAALKALNLNVGELRQLDPAEALRRVAVAFAGFADDGNKARFMSELFGKSVKEFAPFLKDLAEQGALVAKVTSDQAAEAERFNKALFQLSANAKDAGRALLGDIVPALNQILVLIQEIRKGPGIFAALGEAAKGNTFKSATEGLASYNAEIAKIDKTIGTLKADKRPLVAAFNGSQIQKLETERNRLESFATVYRNVLNAGNAGAGRGSVNPGDPGARPSLGPLPGSEKDSEAEKLAASYKTLLASIREKVAVQKQEFDSGRALTESEKLRISFTADLQGKLKDLLPTQRALITAEIDQLAVIEKRIAARQRDVDAFRAGIEAEEERNGAFVEGSKINERMGVAESERFRAASEALDLVRMEQSLAGRSAADRAAALAQYRVEIDLKKRLAEINGTLELTEEQRSVLADRARKTADVESKLAIATASADAAETLRTDVKGAISAALRDTKNPIEAFGNALANVVYTRLTERTASALANALIGTGASGDTGLLGSLFSFLSFDGGGTTGPGVRAGGIDGKGGFPAILHPNETVIDHTKGGAMRGAGMVFAPTTSITVAGGMNRGEVRATVQQALDANNRALAEQLRQRGVLE